MAPRGATARLRREKRPFAAKRSRAQTRLIRDQGYARQSLKMAIASQQRRGMRPCGRKNDSVGRGKPMGTAGLRSRQSDCGPQRNNAAELRERNDLIRVLLSSLPAPPPGQFELDNGWNEPFSVIGKSPGNLRAGL